MTLYIHGYLLRYPNGYLSLICCPSATFSGPQSVLSAVASLNLETFVSNKKRCLLNMKRASLGCTAAALVARAYQAQKSVKHSRKKTIHCICMFLMKILMLSSQKLQPAPLYTRLQQEKLINISGRFQMSFVNLDIFLGNEYIHMNIWMNIYDEMKIS